MWCWWFGGVVVVFSDGGVGGLGGVVEVFSDGGVGGV